MAAHVTPPGTTEGVVERIFAAWNAADISWVLLRGRARLGAEGRDVDLLVARDDLGPAEDAVFAVGGVALPRRLHPWHRFYPVHDRQTGERVLLDVVTELVYGRGQQVRSELEAGCLDRRRRDGEVYVLDPTDLFWTALLHCLLDKGSVGARRRAELQSALPELGRPSPGEDLFARVCPPGWSPDRAVFAVAAGDWDVLSWAHDPARPAVPVSGSAISASATTAQHLVRRAARAAYPMLWRRAGLGATPAVLDVVDAAGTPGIVADVHRRPGLCQVELVVADHDQGRLATTMRAHGYRRIAGAWHRATATGLERVDVLRPGDLSLSPAEWVELDHDARPVPGHPHCRRGRRGLPAAQSPTHPLRVSVSGLDGAGKSEQITALVASLRQERSVEVVWMPTRVWPEPLLNRLPAGFRSRLGPRRTPPRSGSTVVGPRRGRVPGRALVWTAIATVAGVSVGASLRRRASSSSADVLVLDRYRLDSLVKLCGWYSEAPIGWLTRLVGTLAPAADVELLLRVDPAVAYARKPEQWSVSQLRRQARLYDSLAGRLEVIPLDGQQATADVARAVASHVRAALDDRTQARRGGRSHGH